jgi:hypothetical protein
MGMPAEPGPSVDVLRSVVIKVENRKGTGMECMKNWRAVVLATLLTGTAGTALAQSGVVTCESVNYGNSQCRIDGGPVTLVRQISSAACVEGRSWGYDESRGFIWVSNGCAGEFQVGRPSGPVGGSSNWGGSAKLRDTGVCHLANIKAQRVIYNGECKITQEAKDYGALITIRMGSADPFLFACRRDGSCMTGPTQVRMRDRGNGEASFRWEDFRLDVDAD